MSRNTYYTRQSSLQNIHDEKGRMLRDPRIVLGRWALYLGTLLNVISDKVGFDTIKGLAQWPTIHALGVEQTENESIGGLRSMANADVVGPEGFLVEILKLGLIFDPTMLQGF